MTKDLHKNPTFYYILVPALVALWPLLVWAVYLPNARKSWESDKQQYNDGQLAILSILELDPGRLELAGSGNQQAEFDFIPAVSEVAGLSGISAADCVLKTNTPRRVKGRMTQTCDVTLNRVDIGTFAEFLSGLQLRWPTLELDEATFTKKQGLPDTWKIVLKFKYVF
jgi:hypothetical protein